jgi:adenosylhomocysteine nucleosidase
MLGILAALEEESRLLKGKITSPKTAVYAGVSFTSGKLGGSPVVMGNTGVGKVNAAVVTQILITQYKVDNLILMGLAGGSGPDVKIGDIVISKDAVQHDVDATGYMNMPPGEIPLLGVRYFPADARLIKLAEKAARKASAGKKIQVITGRVMTGDQFINSGDKVRRLWETFGGDCVEMEGSAAAQCAFLNKVPWVIVRMISDKCDEAAEKSFLEVLGSEAPGLLAEIAVLVAEELA